MSNFIFSKDLLANCHEREKYTQTIAWAIPDDNAISKICEFVREETILKIGAGLGYWAKLLRDKGVKIIPTDTKESNWKHNSNPSYLKIICENHVKAIEDFPESTVLFLAWPPYSDKMAEESLVLFKGSKLIYIGESMRGCNATDEFFDILLKEWELKEEIAIQQWDGLHDGLFLYKRILA